MNETSKEASEALSALGFELEIQSGPRGTVRDEWPDIQYTVKLHFHNRVILTTEYHLGVGHVDPKNARLGSVIGKPRLTADEESLLRTWHSKPHASFLNKQLWADVAAKLAKYQTVSPSLADVVHSLLLDGEAFFNAQTFADWASDHGYDTDSRKAEAIYRACDESGRKLARVDKAALDVAREILKDF